MMTTAFAALAIGLALGLLGSGGSILTVPALVYVLGHAEKLAIAESLGIVGALAALGALPYQRQGNIVWRSVLLFGLPGVLGTYGGAWLSQWVPGAVQLLLFAATMLLAAALMIRKPKERSTAAAPHPAWQVALEGVAVGVLTGLVGVGGGFLIVPALSLLGGLPMRQAVGTSLVVIAAKSFAGFGKYLHLLDEAGLGVDWTSMGWFVALGAAGTYSGNRIGGRMPQTVLRGVFAAFLVAMGLYVIAKEAPKLWRGPSAAPIDEHWTPAAPESMSPPQRQAMANAEAARDALSGKLMARLEGALKSGGPAGAIGVCQTEAPELAASVAAERGVAIGRTSWKLRNPANAAPDWAAAFVAQRSAEPVWQTRMDGEVRGLSPIRLKPLCLICHGPTDSIATDVREVLRQRYSQDQATGFAEGDLRGWFWVETRP